MPRLPPVISAILPYSRPPEAALADAARLGGKY
jgi:hypothetical protein